MSNHDLIAISSSIKMSPNQPEPHDTFDVERLPSLGDFLSVDIAGSTPDSETNIKKDHEQIYATVPVDHM